MFLPITMGIRTINISYWFYPLTLNKTFNGGDMWTKTGGSLVICGLIMPLSVGFIVYDFDFADQIGSKTEFLKIIAYLPRRVLGNNTKSQQKWERYLGIIRSQRK